MCSTSIASGESDMDGPALVGSMQELIHDLHCDFLFLQQVDKVRASSAMNLLVSIFCCLVARGN